MIDIQKVIIVLMTMLVGVLIGIAIQHMMGESPEWNAVQTTNGQTIIGLYKYDEAYYIHQPGIGIIKLYSQNQTNALTELITEANGMKNAPNGANVMVINGVLNS